MKMSIDQYMCEQLIARLRENTDICDYVYPSTLWDNYIVDQTWISSNAYRCLIAVTPVDSSGAQGMADNPSPVQMRYYLVMVFGYENSTQVPECFDSTESFMRALMDQCELILFNFHIKTPEGKPLFPVNQSPRLGDRLKFQAYSTDSGKPVEGLKVISMEFRAPLNIKLIEQYYAPTQEK